MQPMTNQHVISFLDQNYFFYVQYISENVSDCTVNTKSVYHGHTR